MSLGPITRRQFVRSVLAATGLATAMPLLQACGGAPPAPAPTAAPAAPKPAATAAAPAAAPKAAATAAAPAAAPTTAAAAPAATKAPATTGKISNAELRIATNAELPAVDYHWVNASIVYTHGWHIWETLTATDADYNVKPQLANKLDVSADGLTWDIELRKGVKFHNGKEMKSGDVVASLNRWGKLGSRGRTLFSAVDNLEANGDYAIRFRMKRPMAALPAFLGYWAQAPAIMPKEIVDAVGTDKQVSEYIGTGPYKFVERLPDRHVKLTRFDDYSARPEPASGLFGKREAFIKDLYFLPATDDAARVQGLKAGDYQFAMFVPPDNYADLQKNQNLALSITKPFQWYSLVMNTELAPFNNAKLRQAIQAGVDAEQVMQSAGGPKEFWRLDPSIVPYGVWYDDTVKDLYNQKNVAKAKQLIAESGYKGEPLIYLASRAYDFLYKTSLSASQQMKDMGLNVDLRIMDWATLTSYWTKTEGWHMFSTGFNMPPEPALFPFGTCAARWAGFWCNKEVDEQWLVYQKETDFKKRYAAWQKIHRLFWEDAAILKFGDGFVLQAFSNKLKGFNNYIDVFLWNTYLE